MPLCFSWYTSSINQHAIINIFNRVENFQISNLDMYASSNKIIKVWGQRLTLHIFNIRTDIISACSMYPKDIFQWGGILIQATLNGKLYGKVSSDDKKIFMHVSNLDNYKFEKYDNYMQDLILRYVKGYAPISLKDFKHWNGLKEYEFIDEFNKLSSKLVKLKVGKEEYYLDKLDYEKYKYITLKNNRKLKLLGKFDNLLLAYFNKEWIIEKHFIKKVWGKAGQVEALILYNNKIIGTWRYKIINYKINFDIFLFYNFKEEIINQIYKETERIAVFFE